MADFVLYEQNDKGVVTLTLNNPDERNALSKQSQWDEIVDACERIQRDLSVKAVVLTGANSDGANGLRRICEAGGVAVVQRPETAQASMMPQAALDACPKALTMGLSEIAAFLIRLADIREA